MPDIYRPALAKCESLLSMISPFQNGSKTVSRGLFTAVAIALSGCASGDSIIPVFGGSDASQTDVAKTNKLRGGVRGPVSAYCPTLRALPGTEFFRVYDKGHAGDPSHLRYQASITQTARECTTLGDEMFIKVGIAGRVIFGPAGKPGTLKVPVRITALVATAEGNKVLYSKLHPIKVTIIEPDTSALFSIVDEEVSIPAPKDRSIDLFAGIDTGPASKQ